MSQFSEKLKVLVEDSGSTIYQLAKNTGLDRTTIQRSISGERLPGISFVERLCNYLHVSPGEREDLMLRYTICKIGEKVYAGRKYVEGIIEQIAGLHIYRDDSVGGRRSLGPLEGYPQGTQVFAGQYGINKLVRDILEDEACNNATPSICLQVPFSFGYLYDCLRQLYWESGGRLPIQHIVEFSKNPHAGQNPNSNLQVFSQALPFAFCMGNGYRPHYYYATAGESEHFSHALPYYFYTSKCLVLFSTDCKTAILYSDPDIMRVYREHFESCFAQSLPLVQQVSGPLDMLTLGFGEVLDANRVSHVIEPQPCFARYYTGDMIERYLRPGVPQREQMKAAVAQLYSCYRRFDPPLESFFTVEGLRKMVETGMMADLPQSVVLPFTREDRARMLKALRAEIQNDIYYARILDTSKIQISHIATIQIYDNKSLLFMAITDRGIVASMIYEQSICDAFLDFFRSLPESKLLYSKEDTLKIIDECLAQLEQPKEACR